MRDPVQQHCIYFAATTQPKKLKDLKRVVQGKYESACFKKHIGVGKTTSHRVTKKENKQKKRNHQLRKINSLLYYSKLLSGGKELIDLDEDFEPKYKDAYHFVMGIKE